MKDTDCKVIVIGAGVVGLTTATFFQVAVPNAKVTIVADKLLTETTSSGAAGIFYPGVTFRGPNQETTLKWFRDSLNFYSTFIERRGSKQASEAGVVKREVYSVSTKGPPVDQYSTLHGEIFQDYRVLSQNEIRARSGGNKYNFCALKSTVVADCRKYLPYLMRRFEERGGKIIRRKVKTIEELSGDCDLLFNCSGLGAKILCDDKYIIPIREQTTKVLAPWFKYAVYVDDNIYIIPGTEGLVTLGGNRLFEYSNTDVDPHDADGIWERCISFSSDLKDAKVLQEWVGLHPYRHEVRVEMEAMKFRNGKTLNVVHNYGHGAYGIMTSPGTSMTAVALGVSGANYHRKRRSKKSHGTHTDRSSGLGFHLFNRSFLPTYRIKKLLCLSWCYPGNGKKTSE